MPCGPGIVLCHDVAIRCRSSARRVGREWNVLELVASFVVDNVLQAVGWAVLKVGSFGRYRGFQPEDVALEATVGGITLAVAGYGLFVWVF